MLILSRKSEEFFCEEPNHYEEEDEDEEGLENEELELPINDIFERIPYIKPEPELPINDIFENEIPYDEELAMFEYEIRNISFEFMTFCEFRHYLPQFYKFLSKRCSDYNCCEPFQKDIKKIYDIFINHNSFNEYYFDIDRYYFMNWFLPNRW